MLRVRVDLIRGGIGEPEQIAEMTIHNDDLVQHIATNGSVGSYTFALHGKGGRLMQRGRVTGWPRKRKHVWALVARCLEVAGYPKR